jgi:ATP-dependent helicase HrpA
MNFRLIDEHGRQLELERNLSRLRAEYGQEARSAFQAVAQEAVATEVMQADSNKASLPRSDAPRAAVTGGYRQWDFGTLPETLEIQKGNKTLFGYPALVDQGEAVDLEVFDDLLEARKVHWQGLRRLFAISQKDTLKALQKQMPGIREIGLLFINIGQVDLLTLQILQLALERAFMQDPLPSNAEEFAERVSSGKPRLTLIAHEIARHTLAALEAYTETQKKMAQAKAVSQTAHADMTEQIQGLIFPNMLAEIPYAQLVHLPRYLKGVALRIEKLRTNAARDTQCQRDWESLARPWQKRLHGTKGSSYAMQDDPGLRDFRWQLEELRIALFAQELKTPTPMSLKRLEKVFASLR